MSETTLLDKEGDRSLARNIAQDLLAGTVVFLVALPLCLGIAHASHAPLFSGLIAGIIGGIVVGILSGSHTSVSGPAAGLTIVVASQIESLGSFELFLLALVVAGALQIFFGLLRFGAIAAFCPSSVIHGLLAAIGLILILKQTPHLLGHDTDPEGEMAFQQPDQETTFSELARIYDDIHWNAAFIGISSLLLLIAWDRWKLAKRTNIPGPLVVVLFGAAITYVFGEWGGKWAIDVSHLVQVPVPKDFDEFRLLLHRPDFSQFLVPEIYLAGVTIAAVASLETLLNLEAVDRLDPKQRTSPNNRELVAQGVGNVLAGLLGGLPVTAVIVRGTVNINAGAKSKISTIFHGTLLLVSVAFFPSYINLIPLSCLAAILLHTGFKLASWALFKRMWSEGLSQFLPFLITVGLIVVTDLLVGVLLGLGVALAFILHGNLRRPIRQVREKHVSGEVLRIALSEQVSFLNRAALKEVLDKACGHPHVLLDAQKTNYFDADVLDLIREFEQVKAPAHGTKVSLVGFKDHYDFQDRLEFVDYTTRELQKRLRPEEVLEHLQAGNERFRAGTRLDRDLGRLLEITARGQYPLAVILGCIDSRTPVELVFDLAIGDVFSVRIAGNVCKQKALGSMEYACAVAGARLVVVLGHTQCGAVTTAVDLHATGQTARQVTGCDHIDVLVNEIQKAIPATNSQELRSLAGDAKVDFVSMVTRRHVLRTVAYIREQSKVLKELESLGEIAIVGGLYDIRSGQVEFFGGLAPLVHQHSAAEVARSP